MRDILKFSCMCNIINIILYIMKNSMKNRLRVKQILRRWNNCEYFFKVHLIASVLFFENVDGKEFSSTPFRHSISAEKFPLFSQ